MQLATGSVVVGSTDNALTRAAANSTASGILSNRWHIVATACAFWVVTLNVGLVAGFASPVPDRFASRLPENLGLRPLEQGGNQPGVKVGRRGVVFSRLGVRSNVTGT